MKVRVRKWRATGREGQWRDPPENEHDVGGRDCPACWWCNSRSMAEPGVAFIEVETTSDAGEASIELRRVEKLNRGWPSALFCKRSSDAEAAAELSGLFITTGKVGPS